MISKILSPSVSNLSSVSSLKSTSPPDKASASISGKIIDPANGLSIVPPESE